MGLPGPTDDVTVFPLRREGPVRRSPGRVYQGRKVRLPPITNGIIAHVCRLHPYVQEAPTPSPHWPFLSGTPLTRWSLTDSGENASQSLTRAANAASMASLLSAPCRDRRAMVSGMCMPWGCALASPDVTPEIVPNNAPGCADLWFSAATEGTCPGWRSSRPKQRPRLHCHGSCAEFPRCGDEFGPGAGPPVP